MDKDIFAQYKRTKNIVYIEPSCWLHLPDEVTLRILEFLDVRSLIYVGQVCSTWRRLYREQKLWREDSFGTYSRPFMEQQLDRVERSIIFSTLFISSKLPIKSAQLFSYSNLSRIVREGGYEYLDPYIDRMSEMIYAALISEDEDLVLHGMEVFGSLCDSEAAFIELDSNRPGYISQLIPKILPALLHWVGIVEESQKDEEDEDELEESFEVASNAQMCLTLMSFNVKDAIVPFVMPFVKVMCTSEDWRQRAASCAVLGAVMEGPSHSSLKSLIEQQLPFLLRSLHFQHETVQDSAAWALGSILEHHFCVIYHFVPAISSALLERIQHASPKVATSACWALSYVVRAFENQEYRVLIASLFHTMLEKLLFIDTRPDAWRYRLNIIAYETAGQIINCYAWQRTSILPVIIERLEDSIRKITTSTGELRENCLEIQSSLCVMIHKFAMSLNTPDIRPSANRLLTLLFQVLELSESENPKRDAMMAIGSLAYSLGPEFYPFMSQFVQYITQALDRYTSTDPSLEVWDEIVSIITDCCYALNSDMIEFSNAIIASTIKGLKNTALNIGDRITLCELFGTIATAIGPEFRHVLNTVMEELQSFYDQLATEWFQQNDNSYFSRDYEEKFLESFFSNITEIVRGLKLSNETELMVPHLPFVVQVVQGLSNKLDIISDTVLSNVLTATVEIMQSTRRSWGFEQPFFTKVIARCVQRESPTLMDVATHSKNLLANINYSTMT